MTNWPVATVPAPPAVTVITPALVIVPARVSFAPAAANIALMEQANANKRLDFEIARLKNCGELMKAGIMFHKKSPYFKVCADVVLVNPPGTLPQHSHSITPNPPPVKIEANGTAEDLKTISIGNK